jgi:hypothetical protein
MPGNPNKYSMIFGYFTLFVALLIEVVGAYYSITGLAAIFSGAVMPILIMGGSLELGKVTAAVWLKNNWERASAQFKLYLLPAVVMLMLITSMGIFGFLSKAHNDQTLVSGDVAGKIAIYDEKIKIQRDNIDSARRALQQMDNAVDQTMSRSSDEKGADKATAIRRSQARERGNLQGEISRAQAEIVRLNDQRAPIAAEVRKVEAEVGPIKYIAKLIYNDNPDADILEKAVVWVIMIIVAVFDPLALVLILAAQQSIRWARGEESQPKTETESVESWFEHAKKRARFWDQQQKPEEDVIDESQYDVSTLEDVEPVFDRETDIPDYEPDDGPLTDEQVEQIRETAKDNLPTGELVAKESLFDNTVEDKEPLSKDPSSPGWMFTAVPADVPAPSEVDTLAHIIVPEIDRNEDPLHHMAKVMWHAANPEDDHRRHYAQHQDGEIDRLPWHTDEHINSLAISDGEKKQLIARFANAPPPQRPSPEPLLQTPSAPPGGDGNLWVPQDGTWVNAGPIDQFDFGDLGLEADNVPTQAGEVKGFGTQFPSASNKGDMFLRVDQLPSMLYKFNGTRWIEVDKALTDSHAYDAAYIDHLIEKISTGEYDPDLLSAAEQESIERRLSNTVRGV